MLSSIFWKVSDIGERLLENGLEINVDPKTLDRIHKVRVLAEYDLRVVGLIPKKKDRVGVEGS